MLVNLSNHPSGDWDARQIKTAESLYGTIVDLPFPLVDPYASSQKVERQAMLFFEKIIHLLKTNAESNSRIAVHIQGEFTFVFNLVTKLKSAGIKCIASTSIRNVKEIKPGEKMINFEFVQFREY
jgi:hypothetical protein